MIIHLKHRGVVKLSGVEARPFLQRLVTQDVIEGDNLRYGALLNAKGKYLYDLFIWFKGGDIYLDSERPENLAKLLNMYKLRADVQIENVSHEYKVYVLKDAIELDDFNSQPDPRNQAIGHRLITKNSIEVTNDLSAYDAQNVLRLQYNVADGSQDMTIDKSLIMDFNFDKHNGISWNKGCYVGQENTNRSRRSELRRRTFVGLVSQVKGLLPEKGEKVMVNDTACGTVCSSCSFDGKTFVGALINLDVLGSGVAFNILNDTFVMVGE